MKSTVLTGVLLLITGAALNAQLSFLPQIGFEQSRTTLNYASLSSPAAAGNLKAALKMDYRFKGGHSPFINLTTSPAPVSFVFNNAGDLIDRFQSSTPKLRLEAGYQYSSKAISLGKGSRARSETAKASSAGSNVQRSACGSLYRSHCGQSKMRNTALQNKPWNLRLQPALALAYVPSATTALVSDANGFEYKTAAWKTALVPSMGFEFAKGQQRLFTLSVFYTKPLENAEATGTGSGFKAVSVPLQSKTTTWGMTLGIPIGFAKGAQPKVNAERGGCQRGQYRRCRWAQ